MPISGRHTFHLTSLDATRIRQALERLVRDIAFPTLGPDDLVRLAAAIPAALPEPLLRAVHRYRSGGQDSDVLLVRGLLRADEDLGPTPLASTATLDVVPAQRAALLLLGVMLLLGEPFNFRTLYSGRLVQHVVPVPRMEFTQTGESSGGTLDWHVEDGFSPDRCDYFGLLCLRGDETAVTEFAAARDVALPASIRAVLGEPRFQMWPDTAHVLDAVTPTDTAVLSGPDFSPEICYDAHYLTPARSDPAAAEALALLRQAIDAARVGHVMKRGDLLILDNRRVVHARTPFQARYDGADRWLMRTMVCSSLPRYRRRPSRILD